MAVRYDTLGRPVLNRYGLYGDPTGAAGQTLTDTTIPYNPGSPERGAGADIFAPFTRSRFPTAVEQAQGSRPGYFAALTGQAPGGAVNSSIGKITRLRLPRNDTVEALNIGNAARVGADTRANDADLAAYSAAIRAGNAGNQADVAQESDFINQAYNGGLDERLGAIRSGYGTAQRGAITSAADQLAAARASLRGEQTGNINRTAAELAAERGTYEGRVGGEITGEEAARAGLRTQLGAARRRATDVAIADSSRATKSQLANSGGGGGSYFSRLALGARTRAEAALANDLADRAYQDYGLTRAQRAGLTETLSGRQRGEIAGTGAANLNLGYTLGDQQRSDLGYTLGREDALNRDLSAAERGDVQYVRGQAGQLLGARRTLRTSSAADALLPINARSAVTSGRIRDTSGISTIDLGNTFYGLDDGSGDAARLPRIPYLSRSRPSVDYAPQQYGYGPANEPGRFSPPAPQPSRGTGLTPEQEAQYFQQYGEWPYGTPPTAPEKYGPTRNPIPLAPWEKNYDTAYDPYAGTGY